MTTPHDRLARMRKSFEKDRSVLADDYNYFITLDASKPRGSIPRSKVVRKSEGQPVPKSPKRS
jgi:hypothetical protein